MQGSDFIIDLQSLARALGGEIKNGQVLAPGPGHSAIDRSLAVRPDLRAPGGFVVHSFAEDDPIQCRDYVREKCGLPAFQPNGNGRRRATSAEITALVASAAASQRRDKPKQPTAVYRYTDEIGKLLYEVLRYDNPKTFRQRQPLGGGWTWNLNDARRVLYRLSDLLAYPDGTIFVCEGEKDADRVASLNHCATTVASGRWTDVDIKVLAGRDCIILQDADLAGARKALAAAHALHGTAATIRIVLLPELTGHSNNKDVSDWLDADPRRAEKFVDICFNAPLWEPDEVPAEPEPPPPEEKIKLTFFDEITDAVPKPWLIKGVMARGETSSWIAQPGKGKSALLTDIAIHVASGKDWRGHRTKGRAGVVIFALERADLVRRRLRAHRLRDQLPTLPIAVFGKVVDLMHKSCANFILAVIRHAEERFGCEVGLVIIDTYPKGIAAGGGDESQAKDQNICVANLRRVLDHVNVHIAGIGHTGKDESRGERGSNARLADVDLQIQISGEAIKTATVTKANDQPEGPLTSFRLEPFDFGPDEDGDPFQTFILSGEVITGIKAERSLSDKQRLALEALAEVTLSHGRDAPSDYQLPPGIKVVAAESWREELLRRRAIDPGSRNPWARFNDLRAQLQARRLIGVRDDFVWLAGHTPLRATNYDPPDLRATNYDYAPPL